jgi:hypothetical protein
MPARIENCPRHLAEICDHTHVPRFNGGREKEENNHDCQKDATKEKGPCQVSFIHDGTMPFSGRKCREKGPTEVTRISDIYPILILSLKSSLDIQGLIILIHKKL